MSQPNIAIIAAEFNKPLVEFMIAAASDELTRAGATVPQVLRVPGCYEIPLLLKALLGRADVDAAIVLGYIERGETQHGQVMGEVVHAAVIKLELEYDKPVGIGIIGPGATSIQAEARKDDYARASVRAALTSLAVLQKIKQLV